MKYATIVWGKDKVYLRSGKKGKGKTISTIGFWNNFASIQSAQKAMYDVAIRYGFTIYEIEA